MSLTAVQLLVNIADPQKDSLLEGFFAKSPAERSILFRGDINQVELYPLVPDPAKSSSNFWVPAPGVVANRLRLIIGDPDKASSGGTASLSLDGDSTGLTAIGPANDEATIQAAVTANPAFVTAGGATVKKFGDGRLQFTFTTVGAKSLILGNGALLTPSSVVSVARAETGDESTHEVQVVQFLQRPYVTVSDFSAMDAPSVTVEELRAGANGPSGVKAMFSIAISGVIYGGSFSVLDSGPISWDASDPQFQAAFPGWNVIRTGGTNWTVEKQTVGVQALTESDVNISDLKFYQGYRGTLKVNRASLFVRFFEETATTFTTKMEAKSVDGSTELETLYFGDQILSRDLLSSGAMDPNNWNSGFYTKADIDAIIISLQQLFVANFNSAGNSSLPKLSETQRTVTWKLNPGAGSGAYTRTATLETTDCIAGDIVRVVVNMPASANPTIEIRNATSGGTLLYTITGTGSAFKQILTFTYASGAWESDQ